MRLSIRSVDFAPRGLLEQCPIEVELVRELPGPDRPDYWLGRAIRPIRWFADDLERTVTHVVVAARWEGVPIETGARDLPIGIAFVIDDAVVTETELDFEKCTYVAIGIATVQSGAEDARDHDESRVGEMPAKSETETGHDG